MANKHYLFKTIALTTGSIFTANTVIDYLAKQRKMCSSDCGYFYSWKYGEIYYTKHGKGSPVLLIHNLDATSSSYEWLRTVKKLCKNHTVYTIDLLGCGQSDKPALTYTNYLYVQLITDFIKEIIREKTSVITSGDSNTFVVMANHIQPALFDKIIMINPADMSKLKMRTTKYHILRKRILFTPLIGTALYNFYFRQEHIENVFRKDYIFNRSKDCTRYIDIYYQSAHSKHSNGRFLFASKLCGYTNTNLSIGLKGKKNLYIIESTSRKNAVVTTDAYVRVNRDIEVNYISNAKLLPQLEVPEQLLKIINNDIEK